MSTRHPVDRFGLTERQHQVLTYIADYHANHGYSPSVREIGSFMGDVSLNAVHDCMQFLVKAGAVTRVYATARTILVTPHGREALAQPWRAV